MTAENDRFSRAEILFLAVTRPSLTAGVPLEGFCGNIGFTFIAGMVLSGPNVWRSPFLIWAVVGGFIHFVMRRVVAWDVHGFRTIRLYMETTGIGRTTLRSLPTRLPRSGRDLASSV